MSALSPGMTWLLLLGLALLMLAYVGSCSWVIDRLMGDRRGAEHSLDQREIRPDQPFDWGRDGL